MRTLNIIYVLIFGVFWINCHGSSFTTLRGSLDEKLEVSVSKGNETVITYSYNASAYLNDTYLRVVVEASMAINNSVLVVLKYGRRHVKVLILRNTNNASTIRAERTICPLLVGLFRNVVEQKELKAYISSHSRDVARVKIEVQKLQKLTLMLAENRSIVISDFSPVYHQFRFTSRFQQFNIRVESSNNSCMILSIQDLTCPVYDDIEDIKFSGLYQTVIKKGSMIVQAANYKSNAFFLVFVHNSNNGFCNQSTYSDKRSFTLQKKVISAAIFEIQSYWGYLYPVFLALAVYGAFFLVVLLIEILEYCCCKKAFLLSDDKQDHEEASPNETIFKPFKGNYLYMWDLAIISAFYSPPVIQLFSTYTQMVYSSGSDDLCYYNFSCARPFYNFYAFNNIISNMGYFVLGSLSLFITYMRKQRYGNYTMFMKDEIHKIPYDSSIFYAMGISLVMTGVLSICYHICPTKDNLQFDTTYMFIMVCLAIIQIHHIRLPDLNTPAKYFFIVVSIIIIYGVIAERYNSIWVWIVYFIAHVTGSCALTTRWYYKGKDNCSQVLSRVKGSFASICKGKFSELKPEYSGRFVAFLIIVTANIGLSIYGVIILEANFQRFYIEVLLVNLFGYFSYYLGNKIYYCEHWRISTIFYFIFATVLSILAGLCYMNAPTDWQLTPSESREMNSVCVFLDFYDIHDIWHFVSSFALFFIVLAIQSVDDGLLRHSIHPKELKNF